MEKDRNGDKDFDLAREAADAENNYRNKVSAHVPPGQHGRDFYNREADAQGEVVLLRHSADQKINLISARIEEEFKKRFPDGAAIFAGKKSFPVFKAGDMPAVWYLSRIRDIGLWFADGKSRGIIAAQEVKKLKSFVQELESIYEALNDEETYKPDGRFVAKTVLPFDRRGAE